MKKNNETIFRNAKSIESVYGKELAYDFIIAILDYGISGNEINFSEPIIDFAYKNIIKGKKSGKAKEKVKKDNETSFEIPTLDDIKKIIKEKNYNVNPDNFYLYYSEREWHYRTGEQVKDWKKCLARWNLNSTKNNSYNNKADKKVNESDIDNFFKMVENR